jgi:hypothetical protein
MKRSYLPPNTSISPTCSSLAGALGPASVWVLHQSGSGPTPDNLTSVRPQGESAHKPPKMDRLKPIPLPETSPEARHSLVGEPDFYVGHAQDPPVPLYGGCALWSLNCEDREENAEGEEQDPDETLAEETNGEVHEPQGKAQEAVSRETVETFLTSDQCKRLKDVRNRRRFGSNAACGSDLAFGLGLDAVASQSIHTWTVKEEEDA